MTSWVATASLLLATMLVPSLVSGQTCSLVTLGFPCTSSRGYDGVCGRSQLTFGYGCFETGCQPGISSCSLCNVVGTCSSKLSSEILCEASTSTPIPTVGAACSTGGGTGTCQASGVCQAPTPSPSPSPGVASDPIITGFDGKTFHFDQTGEFTLLSSGDGLRVDVTFAGAAAEVEEEKCWTSSVRFIAPNGDMVACALPAIQPNTSRVQMTAMPAQAPAEVVLLSSRNRSVELADMTATAVLSQSGQVMGCQVSTPRMQATVYQVSGYEQALLHPEEAWAAPYTWLNTDVKLTKPLPAPVTGILGATYPVDKETETEFLRALGEPNGAGAAVVGEPGARRLSGVDVAATSYFLTSSVVGIARS